MVEVAGCVRVCGCFGGRLKSNQILGNLWHILDAQHNDGEMKTTAAAAAMVPGNAICYVCEVGCGTGRTGVRDKRAYFCFMWGDAFFPPSTAFVLIV